MSFLDRLFDSSPRGSLLFGCLLLDFSLYVDLGWCTELALSSAWNGRACRLADDAAQTLQCVVQFAGHDPNLVSVTACDRGQHLHVLVGKQRLVRLARVNGVEDGSDCLRLALGPEHRSLSIGLGPQHRSLPVTLRPQDRRLLLTAGRQNLRLPLTFCEQDHCPLVPLCSSTFLHGIADRGRRFDRTELDAIDLDSPLACCLVENHTKFLVDLLATGQRLFQI